MVKPSQGQLPPKSDLVAKITVRGELAKQAAPSGHRHRFLIEHLQINEQVPDTKFSGLWAEKTNEIRAVKMQVSFRKKGEDTARSDKILQSVEEIKKEEFVSEKTLEPEKNDESDEQYKHLHEALLIEYVFF